MASTVTGTRNRGAHEKGLGKTNRRDNWWVGPLLTALGLGAFGVYATFRALYGAEFEYGYHVKLPEKLPETVLASDASKNSAYILSPFYSPLFAVPSSWPTFVTPAFFILWAPGGFRLTCYYYRKAYYRAFFLDPPACGVGEPRNAYGGETRLFLFQNIHRYFLYVALIFLLLLAKDVVEACIWPTSPGPEPNGFTFGLSVGTLVLAVNTTLLTLYTLSCHSLRHLVGGSVDCYSCVAFGNARHQAWKGVSILNQRHMLFAWLSLFMVGFADFYVWMVASGHFTDIRII